MNIEWFQALGDSLIRCESQGLFQNSKISLGQDVLGLSLQKGTGFVRFEKVFSVVESLAQPSFNIYCLQADKVSELPDFDLKRDQMDRYGTFECAKGRCMLIYYQELSQIRVIDLEHGYALFLAEDAGNLPSWDYYSPLKEVFHVWCLYTEKVLLHAGSVCRDGRGVLFVGPGGTGKSTATTQALDNGLQSAGDDYVVVCLKTLQVINLYRSLKLIQNTEFGISTCLSGLPCEFDRRNAKSVYLVPVESSLLVSEFVLTGLLRLNRAHSYKLKSVSSSATLVRLMLSTTMQIPLHFGMQMQAIATLIKRVRSFECSLGVGKQAMAESIQQLMGEVLLNE